MENNNELKEQLFGSAAKGVYDRIQSYRDNGTQADEFLRIGWALMFLSMFFTIGYGIVFHYNLTLPYIGATGAAVFAVAFTAFIEVGKFYTGRWALRNLFFGIFKQGIPSFAIMVFGLAISAGTFYWSYWNSTKGVAYITGYLAETKIERQTVDVAGSLAPVDARQGEIKSLADRGLEIKWKGKVTRSGQRIAERAAAANLEAEKQRTILLEQGTKEQARLDTHRDTFIDKVANMLAMLGGKMEYLQIILLLGIVAAERTLYDRMKQTGATMGHSFREHKKYTPPPPANFENVEGPAFAQKSSMWENRANPIGFNVQNDGNVRSTINGTPAASVGHSVAQPQGAQNYLSSDHTLKHLLTRIKRDVANLTNENGTPRTVCGRMHNAINEAGQALASRDFKPSPKVATDFYKYMDRTVFPLLDDNRRPYEYAEAFMRDLLTHVDVNELMEA